MPDYDNSYIFNFGDLAWREGPKINYEMESADGMPVQMEKTFYVIGGWLIDGATADVIYMFDNENYIWELVPTRLKTSRGKGCAIAVPDEVVYCS